MTGLYNHIYTSVCLCVCGFAMTSHSLTLSHFPHTYKMLKLNKGTISTNDVHPKVKNRSIKNK